ncbi:histidine decarboxylase [Trifolium repens]|nr:histidine decarboxylase [Trifolium repens]
MINSIMDSVNVIDMNFDLNECPIDDMSHDSGYSQTIVEHSDHAIVDVDDIGSLEKENLVPFSENIQLNEFLEEVDKDGTCSETNIIPFVGQIFLSEEEAYAFYKRYAYHHGFSIRKGRFIKQNGIASRRDFFCHREGSVSLKIIDPSKEQRKRESTRCDCKAHLRVSLQKSHDIFPSEWRVTKFVPEHNHCLLTQSETILFGCALLRNETMATFGWLMKNFVSLMKKPPKTILTDQDPWMKVLKEAISKELPSTKHSFCIWHITFKFSSWFNAILRGKYAQWCSDFYALYRNYWALAYLRDYFFGGMTTTGRSESINEFIKRFINSHTSLTDFAKQVEIAIDDIKQKEEQ